MTLTPRLFDLPFAVDGDLGAVPDATQTNGSVSYQQGFGILYSTAVASGGYDFPRVSHNQLLNDITTFIAQLQQNGVPLFYTGMSTSPLTGYPQYARVLYTDGNVYESLIANNTDSNPSTSSNWTKCDASAVVMGNCYLSLSGSSIILSRNNGILLTINGVPQTVPSSPISLAPAGLTASTAYYVYAYMNSGTMTLLASATIPVVGSNGQYVMTGDATKTLVGGAHTNSSTAWDVVSSYYNQQDLTYSQSVSGTTTSTTLVELNSAERIGFFSWGNSALTAAAPSILSNNTASQGWGINIGIDGSAPGGTACSATDQAATASTSGTAYLQENLAMGYHYATVYGQAIGSGTVTYTIGFYLKIRG